jgi:hypothetical protein
VSSAIVSRPGAIPPSIAAVVAPLDCGRACLRALRRVDRDLAVTHSADDVTARREADELIRRDGAASVVERGRRSAEKM